MTREEKDLLLKDLCARLPYGVIVQVNDVKGTYDSRLVQVFCDRLSCSVNVYNPLRECICIDSVKPYLRPISSMTEEEKEELRDTYAWIYSEYPFDDEDEDEDGLRNVEDVGGHYEPSTETYDWYNRKMFDYRGLIQMGSALEAPEGMYEIESNLVIDNSAQITVGCKIRSKTNPDVILSIISDDCHEDEFECSNGSVLSLKQIEKYYDLIK